MSFKLSTVTAFVAIDKDNGDEGIISFQNNNIWMPMVCGDEERIAQMLPIAERICKEAGTSFRILQFSVRTDVTDLIKAKYAINKGADVSNFGDPVEWQRQEREDRDLN